MVIFKSKSKEVEGDLKMKLSGKRLYPTENVKYLGVIQTLVGNIMLMIFLLN